LLSTDKLKKISIFIFGKKGNFNKPKSLIDLGLNGYWHNPCIIMQQVDLHVYSLNNVVQVFLFQMVFHHAEQQI
jgi:hypothetical protein